ncbi:hypothetical protein RJT34_24548 [Clitoria ternatea]|uniref:Uncharacterized protein n=1 Tax=Clitoria ternatea TaxID=43366 RepID=A0AAN9FUC2_CLITE
MMCFYHRNPVYVIGVELHEWKFADFRRIKIRCRSKWLLDHSPERRMDQSLNLLKDDMRQIGSSDAGLNSFGFIVEIEMTEKTCIIPGLSYGGIVLTVSNKSHRLIYVATFLQDAPIEVSKGRDAKSVAL